MTSGGKREGAGRKCMYDAPKKTVSVTLTEEMMDYLSQGEQSRGEAIEAIVRRTKDFKDWQKERNA